MHEKLYSNKNDSVSSDRKYSFRKKVVEDKKKTLYTRKKYLKTTIDG